MNVAPENLPAVIQRELGYTVIPQAPEEAKSAPPPVQEMITAPAPATPAPDGNPPAPDAQAQAAANPAPAAPKIFFPDMADMLYGMKKADILKKWGQPLRIEKFTSFSKRKGVVLIYDEDVATGTKFFIYDKDGFVSGGYCGGKLIRSAAQEATLYKTKTAGN